jgi:hypothetical protein
MHHPMTTAAPARTVTKEWPAVAVKTDIRTGHDIAYVTRGHTAGCAGAMAYYTRAGEPPGTWEGRGCAALGVTGTVEAEVAERLYQQGVGPGGERIIRHAAPKSDEDQAAAEAAAIARYREKHPFASATEINAERTRIRATSPGISRPYYDVTSSASKSVSVLHASLRVAAGQARQAGDHVTAASLDGEAQAIEDALLDAVREGLELLEAMACYVRTGHHSKDTGEWRDGKGLVATSWLHTISRDGDPQLHVHLAVLNAVQRADGADGKWRAADGQHFYQLRHLYGVTVDRAFEQRLLDMGYAMTGRADGNGAEVGGVSLTPHKGDPVRERMRKDAITQLEIRDEEQLYRVMSRGELEANELRARRAYAAGPKDVSAQLKDTAQAEADQRQQPSRPRPRVTRRPPKRCSPSPTSWRRRRRPSKRTTPSTRAGRPRRPGAAKTGRKLAPSSLAAATPPRPVPARRTLNGGSVSSATARPSTSTWPTSRRKRKPRVSRGHQNLQQSPEPHRRLTL